MLGDFVKQNIPNQIMVQISHKIKLMSFQFNNNLQFLHLLFYIYLWASFKTTHSKYRIKATTFNTGTCMATFTLDHEPNAELGFVFHLIVL